MWRRSSSSNGWKIESSRPSNSSGLTRKRRAQREVERRRRLHPFPLEVAGRCSRGRRTGRCPWSRRSRGVVRWFFTSAKPTRAAMPAARAQAASSDALPTQNPSPASRHGRRLEHQRHPRSRGTGCSGSRRAPRSTAKRRARAAKFRKSSSWKIRPPRGASLSMKRPGSRNSFIGRASSGARAPGTAALERSARPSATEKWFLPGIGDVAGERGAPALAEQRVLAQELARLVAADAGHHRRARGGRHERRARASAPPPRRGAGPVAGSRPAAAAAGRRGR